MSDHIKAVIIVVLSGLIWSFGPLVVKNMIELANLTREGFKNGDISNLMSPRTVISWAENYQIFSDLASSFELSFLNKCDETEKSIISKELNWSNNSLLSAKVFIELRISI